MSSQGVKIQYTLVLTGTIYLTGSVTPFESLIKESIVKVTGRSPAVTDNERPITPECQDFYSQC
jgi:hypothetical protein